PAQHMAQQKEECLCQPRKGRGRNPQTGRMSKQEMLVLSTKDRDRLKVLHEVKRKHLTQRAAARQLAISDRWVRKLLVRVRKGGDGGIVHRGRGRRSSRRCRKSRRTQTRK